MNYQNTVIHFTDRERDNFDGMYKWFRGIGIALVVVGILALILPYLATLTVEILVGVILIVSAIMHATHAFQVRRWRNITWEAVFAVLFFITGILFLVYPFSGMMALTILLGLFFLIYGGFKIPLALSWKPRPGWGWIMTSGILTVILGLILIIGLPGTAVWAIGLILGIDLIFTGATLLALGSKLKSLAHG